MEARMGYTVDLDADDLRCKSEADAVRAAEVVNSNEWMTPYHFQVSARQFLSGDHQGRWFLEIENFQSDHWHDDEAKKVWLAIAPFMADGATIEVLGEGLERWRIRWQEGRVFEDYVAEVIWAENIEITAPAKENAS
jgi:hypothetical protein